MDLRSAEQVVERLRTLARPESVAGMARYGISSRGTLGVPMPALRALAKGLRPGRKDDPAPAHRIALGLWETGIHEARILASLVDVPALVTRKQAEAWARDIDSWDVGDGLCNNLLDRTTLAYELAREWAGAEAEYVKRAGFVLMCTRAVHDRDAPDATFLELLALVEREADDGRPMVRKAVNWALRQIGKRDRNLHEAAVDVALRLRDSGSRAARWVASDALRELRDDRIVARIKS